MTLICAAAPSAPELPPRVVWEQPYQVASDDAWVVSRAIGWAILDLQGASARPRSLSFPPVHMLVGESLLLEFEESIDLLSLEPFLRFDGYTTAHFAEIELSAPLPDFD